MGLMGLGVCGQETEVQGDFGHWPGTGTGLCAPRGSQGTGWSRSHQLSQVGQSRKSPPPFLGDFYTHSLTHLLTHSFPEGREGVSRH